MDKTALITGASGGVARALAARLREEGWRLALVGRDAARMQPGAGDHVIVADVSTQAGAGHAVAAAAATFGKAPAALAHCAGSSLIAPIGRTGESEWRSVMAANLDSAFFTLKAWLAARAPLGEGGSAVLFSSVVAGIGVANHPAIAAAKAGVEALVRSLAADGSSAGFRFNAIAPGLLATPMTARMIASEQGARQIALQYPLGRFGQAEDAAELAAFLLDDRAGWISGEVIRLDGGFSAVRPYLRA